MRRNKLIFAGEKKVASHSPTGLVLSEVDTADRPRVVGKVEICFGLRKSARGWGVGAMLAGPTKPHAVVTEPRATETTVSFMLMAWNTRPSPASPLGQKQE